MDPQEIAALKEEFTRLNSELKSLGGTAFKEMPKDVADVQKAVKLLRNEIYDIKNAFGSISQTLKNTIVDFNTAGKLIGSINSSFSKLSSLTFKVQQHNEGTNRLTVSQLKNIKSIANAEVENLKNQQSSIAGKLAETTKGTRQYQTLLAQQDELNDALKKEGGYLLSINKDLEKLIENEIKLNKNLGISGALFKGISKTLQSFGVDSMIIEEMGDKLRKAADGGKVGFKKLFPIIKEGLTKALQDPLVQFTIGLKLVKSSINDIKKGFDIFKEYNALFVNTARNIGMSVDQVTKMGKEAAFTKNTIEGTNGAVLTNVYSQKQLQQAISDVNTQLGLSVDLGAETIDEFTAMTNQMGLSAAEAANIYKLGALTNLSLQDTNKAISAQIVATQKSTGVQLNAKQVFQEIGKLNAGITSKFQQNPTLIAKAVAQAKALGTTLEQIDKVGESLLNFETSIENELKAELITGKQLNLERARAAALTGDQVTLMNEVASQVGNLEDFNRMNVIAQKSLAEAFGMTRGEMAEMLQQQEVFNKLGDVSGKSAAEQLEIARQRGLTEEDSLVVNLKQQATAEKVAAAFDSLKLVVADLFSAFQPLLELMADLSKHTSLVYGALALMVELSFAKTIGGLILMASQLGLISLAKTTGAAADLTSAGALAAQNIAAGPLIKKEVSLTGLKVAQATASSIINPVAAIAGLALAGIVAAAIYGASQKVNDGVAPASKGPFTITDKFGATAITAVGDGLAVSPNYPGRQNNLPSGINARAGATDLMLTSLIAKFETTMMKLVDSNKELSGRPVAITTKTYLERKEIGTSLVQGSSRAV
jgi:hypothetical protein